MYGLDLTISESQRLRMVQDLEQQLLGRHRKTLTSVLWIQQDFQKTATISIRASGTMM